MKNVYIIAGANGSGKTIFAKKFLPRYVKCNNFINADLIAQGISPFSPSTVSIKAGKIVLDQIKDYANKNMDFAFETTLSGKTYTNLLKDLKKRQYKIHFFYLWIPDFKLALARIKDRVAEGGHDIPVIDVKRRFSRSINNFFSLYIILSDSWMLFDNSNPVPKLIAKYENGNTIISDNYLFNKIEVKNNEKTS